MRTVTAHYRSRCTLHSSYSVSEKKTSALLGIPKAFTLQYINKAQCCYSEALHLVLCLLRKTFLRFLNTLKFFQARELSRNFVLVCVAVQAPAPAQAQAIYTEFKSIFQPRMEQGDSMKCRNAAPICLKDYITCNVSFCCFSSP